MDGNISADPRLVTFGAGREHVQPDSPCRDAGDDAAAGADWLDSTCCRGRPGRTSTWAPTSRTGRSGPTCPAIVHVTPAGDDAGDGLSWATAKATVQAGLDAASALRGGEVWVAAGTYVEHVTLSAWVHLYGGFAGTEARAPSATRRRTSPCSTAATSRRS